MSLHKGLIWLAEGFEKYDDLAKVKQPPAEVGVSGDQLTQPSSKAQYRLSQYSKDLRPNAQEEPKKVKSTDALRIHHQSGSPNVRQARSKSVGYQVTDRSGFLYPSSRKHRSYKSRPPALSVPNDKTPRTGAKPVIKPGSRKTSQNTTTSYDRSSGTQRYLNMPTHPDMRFFDRHSRCFDHSLCNAALMTSRPRTACTAGRASLQQCKGCGEVTSKVRYQYAPTGSAMTGMDPSNKTYLYPEKILAFDSYTGRRRPSSAPCQSVSRTGEM